MSLDLVSRRDWDALPPTTEIEPLIHPVEHVVYTHNLDTQKCHTDEECITLLQGLQKKHMDEGAPDILYNFLIGGNGKAYEGRGWWKQSDKSLKFSDLHSNRIDIAFIGNYGNFEGVPLDLQCKATYLVQFGVDFQYVSDEHTLEGGFEFKCGPSTEEAEHGSTH